MLLSVALSTASRNRGLLDTSPVPSFAATVISRMSRLKILPRLASVAALRCLMLAHLLWPAMIGITLLMTRKLHAQHRASPVRNVLGFAWQLVHEWRGAAPSRPPKFNSGQSIVRAKRAKLCPVTIVPAASETARAP